MVYIVDGPQFVDLYGRIYQGDINLPVDYTNLGTPDADGWNLVGNPYPCTINWDMAAWTKNNINDAIYIYDAATQQYTSYVNGVGNNGGSGNIAPFQAFWVKANGNNPQLSASENVKNPVQAEFKNDEVDPMRISFSSGMEGGDEITFYWSDEATTAYDANLEAEKYWTSANGSIAAKHNSMDFSILALHPETLNLSIPIEVRCTNSREWSIQANGWENGLNGRCLTLVDHQTNQSYPLIDGELTAVELEEGIFEDRFTLEIGANSVTQVNHPTCFGEDDGAIYVVNPNITQVDWYNSEMELLASSTFNESTLANLEAGVYQVVTQQEGECPVVQSTVILNQPNMITISPDMQAPTCTYTNDGAIHLNPIGGSGEFSYEWSTGSTE
ncbi:MAG: SprB repeat-containing protein, partial [Bacteroidota bacterium]